MKRILFIGIFFLLGVFGYSQTWTESDGSMLTREITVITREDFNRLLKQYESNVKYSLGYPQKNTNLRYIDALELKSELPVIKGTRSKFNGYYYLLIKEWSFFSGNSTILAYGNTNTGRMEIEFVGLLGDFVSGSNEYIKQRNQFWDWVNGE